MITKYIFVDLDETLFHCHFLGVNPTKAMRALNAKSEKLVKVPGKFEEESEFYASHLRPGAHDLLTALRAIQNSKVMALTASVEDYAQANNRTQNLGFEHSDIYSREQLEKGAVPDLKISDATQVKFYLIDNLPRHENRIKVRWIQKLLPTNDAQTNYIKVTDFLDARYDRSFDANLIDDILLQINNLDNS